MTKMGLMNATCGNMNMNIVSRKKRKASTRKEMTIEPVLVELQVFLSIPDFRNASQLVQNMDATPNLSPKFKIQESRLVPFP